MTKSPRQWIDGYAEYQRRRVGDRRSFKMAFLDRIGEDYLRLIVATEIEHHEILRLKESLKGIPSFPKIAAIRKARRRNKVKR